MAPWTWEKQLNLETPHHVHSRKKIAKETSAMRRNAISIQAIVEKEGVLSGLVKLG